MAKTLDEAGVKRLIQEIKGANKNLNTPIPISTENTPESMAQNVKNIADYVEKAKAAGIEDVNGMAVTCLMGDYSGIGYIYDLGGDFNVQGVLIKDDLVDNMVFSIFGGRYTEKAVIVAGNNNAEVTSYMLDKGARNPIILTSDTTEVDEETYQKLLSDDVDVILKVFDIGNICTLTSKIVKDQSLELYFSCLSFQGEIINECYIFGYLVTITKNSPHTCSITENINGALDDFLNSSGYINQPILTPVLQEIDLTGTDADRKAKLDQFEADWKALTGASYLTGARFVGKLSDYYDGVTIIFTYNSTPDNETYQYNWNGIYIPGYDEDANGDQIYAVYYVTINPLNGKISYVNQIANMATYDFRGNLRLTYGASINGEDIYLGATYDDDTGEHIESLTFSNVRLGKVATPKTGDEVTNKAYVDAIKNNASKSLEAITIKTGNTPEDKATNVAAIKAYVDNLIALGVDVTKGYMIPIRTSPLENIVGFIIPNMKDTGYVGLGEIANGHGINIYISNDGDFNNYALQDKRDTNLTTSSKFIVGAINETLEAAKTAQSEGRKGSYMRALYEAEGAKFNEATGYYELNGLTDITEKQMAHIYNDSMRFPKNSPYIAGCYSQSNARTLFRPTSSAIISSRDSNCYETFSFSPNLEYIAIASDNSGRTCSLLVYTFGFLDKLRKIDFPINVVDDQFSNTFKDCKLLEHVLISEFHGGKLSFIDSPRLNYTSLRWLVDKAKNTTAVTVTVHATTYGYLTGMTPPSEQVGGTSEQWTQLMADAAARNISFATA